MSTQSSDVELIGRSAKRQRPPRTSSASRLLRLFKADLSAPGAGAGPGSRTTAWKRGFRLEGRFLPVRPWSLEGRMRQFQERMQQLEPGQEKTSSP
ncbi:MAG: hypothetical protein V8S34_00215 [Lawsonibacter sp.]